jgi:hypothetical protein
VYHILPMCDGVNYDGMEYFNPAINKGAVILFKPSASVASSKTLYLKGLNPSEMYSITFQDGHGVNGTYTGAQLAAGLDVTGMTGAYASEIIWMNQSAPAWAPRLRGIELMDGAAKLTFEFSGASATALAVESTASLTAPVQWANEPNATITNTTPAHFEALVPAQGKAGFYRIRAGQH